MQRSLKLEPDFTPQPIRTAHKFNLVIYVFYTGVGGGRLRGENLYDPPLDGALRRVIEGTGCHIGDLQLERVDNDNEPLELQDAAVLLTRQSGQRWPLAYLSTHEGEPPLDFAALLRAFLSIGGRE